MADVNACPETNDRIADIITRLPAAMARNAVIHRTARLERVAKRAPVIRQAVTTFKSAHPAAFEAIRARADAKQAAQRAESREGVPSDELARADAQVRAWRASPDWVCDYCGNGAPLVAACDRCAEHVMPRSKGGKHMCANLKRACRSCNSRKGNRAVWFA